MINFELSYGTVITIPLTACVPLFFFYYKDIDFQPRLNILILLPILG